LNKKRLIKRFDTGGDSCRLNTRMELNCTGRGCNVFEGKTRREREVCMLILTRAEKFNYKKKAHLNVQSENNIVSSGRKGNNHSGPRRVEKNAERQGADAMRDAQPRDRVSERPSK